MAAGPDETHATADHRRRRRRRRRAPQAIAFAGVLCAGVLIGWVVFRDDGDSPARATPTTTAGQAARIALDPRSYARLGVSFGLPKGWRTTFRRGVLNAASGDGTISVAISAAADAGEDMQVRRSDREQLARLFGARELRRERARVGGKTTVVTEFAGRTRRRQPIRILSLGNSSTWRTYSIQVFSVPRPSPRRLLELRALLSSVRYRRPS